MKIHDISWPLSSATTSYKDKKTISFESLKNFEHHHVRETLLTLSTHSGTHIDAPSHFLAEGKTIEQVPISSTVGPCKVFDLSAIKEGISRKDLEELPINENDIILFKTRNSKYSPTDSFNPNFVYLTLSGAQYLAACNIRAVGIDYLGIERNQEGHATHTTLFNNNITIIEGLRLDAIAAGSYFLCCLPLKIIGIEAAPARAILIEEL